MEITKKYLKGRKLIEIKCEYCQTLFSKPVTEYNRNVILNRKNYCSRTCTGKNVNNLKDVDCNYDISQHSNNLTDEFTGFRYYLRNSKARNKIHNITLQDLKEQWELQKGLCSYTGIKLKLYKYNKSVIPYEQRASLDRIDSSLGYIKGNIEFVSLPINYLKADQFTKEQTLQFLKNISLTFISV
jgi:hypothetical protein